MRNCFPSMLDKKKNSTTRPVVASLKSHLLGLVMAFAIPAHSIPAKAVTDPEIKVQTVLIQKLQVVLDRLGESHPSRPQIVLRIADLFAERARLASIAEINKGCALCEAGKEDRLVAIEHYEKVVNNLAKEEQTKVLIQIGHLYELVGNKDAAVSSYKAALEKSSSPRLTGEAHFSLGEIYFRAAHHSKAISHYAQVIEIPESSNRGLAAYRQAWSYFNSGKDRQASDALFNILKSPELLTRSQKPGVVEPDKQFKEEVSRDLATFLGRQSVGLATIKKMYELSPASTALENVAFLAKELERTGQTDSAIKVWRYVLEKETTPKERLTGLTLLAQLQMMNGLRDKAVKDYHAALATWPQVVSCQQGSDPVCEEIRIRLKNILIDWNKREKSAPTQPLLEAYLAYLDIFDLDKDMFIYAGLVAKSQKKYEVAAEQFGQAIRLLSERLKKGDLAEKKQKKLNDSLEGSLLNQIEVAELSQNSRLLIKAYDDYLNNSPIKKHHLEVRYQKARMLYEDEQYEQAASLLREVALTTEGDPKIKKQAADLSLDALVLVQNDRQIESWAKEYANVFPKSAAAFIKIARTSVFNQAAYFASQANKDKAKQQQALAAAWQTLERADLTKATAAEQIRYYKNKIVLAEKLQKFDEEKEAVNSLLGLGALSEKDRQFALRKKAWLAELTLDFETSLQVSQKVDHDQLSQEEKYLRWAMLADLANQDSRKFLKKYLSISTSPAKAQAVCQRLVRESKNPLKELGPCRKYLEKSPATLAQLYLEIYAKNPRLSLAKKALKAKSVKSTTAGQVLQRELFIHEISKLAEQLQNHKIRTSSQRRMARDLRRRMALTEKAEKLVKQAILSKDWASQVLAFDLFAKESMRLYHNILDLPVPTGLSAEEQEQYLSLLKQQAEPHLANARQVEEKLAELWKHPTAVDQFVANYQASKDSIQKVQRNVLQAVMNVAAPEQKARLKEASDLNQKPATAEGTAAVLLSDIKAAKEKLQVRPLDTEVVRQLLELEKSRGNEVMVMYLESRLTSSPSNSQAEEEVIDE